MVKPFAVWLQAVELHTDCQRTELETLSAQEAFAEFEERAYIRQGIITHASRRSQSG